MGMTYISHQFPSRHPHVLSENRYYWIRGLQSTVHGPWYAISVSAKGNTAGKDCKSLLGTSRKEALYSQDTALFWSANRREQDP